MGAIDIHTHAFPDALAHRAIPRLEEEGDIRACLDGTVGALLASMDRAGIERAVVASIATKPEQFDAIRRWSLSIASERLVPFPSVHPADPEASERIRLLAADGFRGIKLHPYYQSFVVDDDRMADVYEALSETGMALLLHTGFDPAFPRDRIASPARVVRVAEAYPALKLVATHIGAWEDWDEVEKHFLGRPIRTDTAYSLEFMSRDRARAILSAHPRECILFGSDSPWSDQGEALEQLRALGLGEEWERAVLHDNAAELLAGET
jgi:predicted TIM-barrel fold metal-dependent hydrolase